MQSSCRVTSGLVVLAKSKERAAELSEEIRSRRTTKVYLARVKGKFPAKLEGLNKFPIEDFFKVVENISVEDDENEVVNSENNGILESEALEVPISSELTDKRRRVESGCTTDIADSSHKKSDAVQFEPRKKLKLYKLNESPISKASKVVVTQTLYSDIIQSPNVGYSIDEESGDSLFSIHITLSISYIYIYIYARICISLYV
jgi:hypothetical protein